MGNSMLKPLKTKAEYIIDALGNKLNDNFDNNKKQINSLKLPFSKSTINKLAGFITRMKKRKEE